MFFLCWWRSRAVAVLLLQGWVSLVLVWVLWLHVAPPSAAPFSPTLPFIHSTRPVAIRNPPPPSSTVPAPPLPPPPSSSPLPSSPPSSSATPQPAAGLAPNATLEPAPPLLPTRADLDGFSRQGDCDFLDAPITCPAPYLHIIVPHSGRPENLARLVRSFGPHTHAAEEVACTCLLVADVVPPHAPGGAVVAAAAAGGDGDDDAVREHARAWPGPHTLLRWRGQFSKVIAMDQLLRTITTPPDKTIVFVLDVDMIVKAGTIATLRREPQLGRAFYAPIVWKLWQPKNDRVEEEAEWEPDGQVVVNESRGSWRFTGFGMLAFYKQDFDKAGGFQVVANKMHAARHSLYKWGLEDSLHASLLLDSGLQQVRPRSPQLIHLWHLRVRE